MISPPSLNSFLLVLPRFPSHVIFLDGQSVQRIALAWELVGKGEQIDFVFQLGLLIVPTKKWLVVELAKTEFKEILRYTGVFVAVGSGM